MPVTVDDLGRVACDVEIPVSLDDAVAWRLLSDWQSVILTDPFHSRVVAEDMRLRPGVKFALFHGLFAYGFWRDGRILEVRPGRGFSFSDLSQRGPRRGFPHIYRYDILPDGDGRSRIHVSVRGRWTAKSPRVWTAIWLAWVMLLIRFRLVLRLARTVWKVRHE